MNKFIRLVAVLVAPRVAAAPQPTKVAKRSELL
jgi:hypothetical protein